MLRDLEWFGVQPDTAFAPGQLKKQENFLEASYRTSSALHRIGYSPDLAKYYRAGLVSALRWVVVSRRVRLELLLLLNGEHGGFEENPSFAKWYGEDEHPCFESHITNGCVVLRPYTYGIMGESAPTVMPIALISDFQQFYLREEGDG